MAPTFKMQGEVETFIRDGKGIVMESIGEPGENRIRIMKIKKKGILKGHSLYNITKRFKVEFPSRKPLFCSRIPHSLVWFLFLF